MIAPARLWLDPDGEHVLGSNTWPGAVEYVRADLVLASNLGQPEMLVHCAACKQALMPTDRRVMDTYGTYHGHCYRDASKV